MLSSWGFFPTWAVNALVFTCWTLLFSVVLSVGSIFTLSVLSFSARLFVRINLAGFFSFSWLHIFRHPFHQSWSTISSIVFWIFSDFPLSALREWCGREFVTHADKISLEWFFLWGIPQEYHAAVPRLLQSWFFYYFWKKDVNDDW